MLRAEVLHKALGAPVQWAGEWVSASLKVPFEVVMDNFWSEIAKRLKYFGKVWDREVVRLQEI